MKIAAISPQFIYETPPAADEDEHKKTARELHLKLVKPEEPASSNAQDALDRETKEGLKRLSKLLQDKKKKSASDEALEAAKRSSDRRKRRAFALYQDIATCRDPRTGKGDFIDDFF